MEIGGFPRIIGVYSKLRKLILPTNVLAIGATDRVKPHAAMGDTDRVPSRLFHKSNHIFRNKLEKVIVAAGRLRHRRC
jgi:hypothetical protein